MKLGEGSQLVGTKQGPDGQLQARVWPAYPGRGDWHAAVVDPHQSGEHGPKVLNRTETAERSRSAAVMVARAMLTNEVARQNRHRVSR